MVTTKVSVGLLVIVIVAVAAVGYVAATQLLSKTAPSPTPPVSPSPSPSTTPTPTPQPTATVTHSDMPSANFFIHSYTSVYIAGRGPRLSHGLHSFKTSRNRRIHGKLVMDRWKSHASESQRCRNLHVLCRRMERHHTIPVVSVPSTEYQQTTKRQGQASLPMLYGRVPTKIKSSTKQATFCAIARSAYGCGMHPNEIKILPRQPIVVLPDYQGIGVGKRLLNFIAELYKSQTKTPFYILTSNPQIIRGGMKNWKITRFGHASKGRDNTRINNEIRGSLSRKRITFSLQYLPAKK